MGDEVMRVIRGATLLEDAADDDGPARSSGRRMVVKKQTATWPLAVNAFYWNELLLYAHEGVSRAGV